MSHGGWQLASLLQLIQGLFYLQTIRRAKKKNCGSSWEQYMCSVVFPLVISGFGLKRLLNDKCKSIFLYGLTTCWLHSLWMDKSDSGIYRMVSSNHLQVNISQNIKPFFQYFNGSLQLFFFHIKYISLCFVHEKPTAHDLTAFILRGLGKVHVLNCSVQQHRAPVYMNLDVCSHPEKWPWSGRQKKRPPTGQVAVIIDSVRPEFRKFFSSLWEENPTLYGKTLQKRPTFSGWEITGGGLLVLCVFSCWMAWRREL